MKKKKNLAKTKQPPPPPLPIADAESPPPLCIEDAESLPPPPPIHVLPDDVIREILLLLPVKSLVRFTCMCKSWKLIISDHQFVKLHLSRSSANSSADFAHIQLLSEISNIPRSSFDSHVSLSSVPLLFSPQYPKGHFYHPIPKNFHLIGVCNGLVCFEKQENNDFFVCLWNPATRLWSKMSPPLSHQYLYITSGFGYDGVNNTYKVVAVFYYNRYSKDIYSEDQQSVVKIYNMGDSCWRSIQPFPYWQRVPNYDPGVYVSGTLNWLLKLRTGLPIIVSLDLATEEQSQVSLPSVEGFNLILGALKDSLCVLQNVYGRRFVIWQMKEFGAHESWIKLFNFCLEEDLESMSPKRFVLSENEEILLMSWYQLVLYNQRDNTFNVRGVGNYRHRYDFTYKMVENYVESLLSPQV